MAREHVKVTLAHPLLAQEAGRMGLENRKHKQGEEVTLHPDRARDLAGAGYVEGVNPQNPEQIREMLGQDKNTKIVVVDGPVAAAAVATAAVAPVLTETKETGSADTGAKKKG